MPAKKERTRKTPTLTLRTKALDALARLTDADVDGYMAKAEEWRRRMVEAEELLKKGEATLFANAAAVVETNQKLADLQRQLAAKDKELERDARAFAGIDGEITFLWEEIDRFRDRLLNYIRWEMQLPEDARVALNTVRAQEFEDKLDEDAEETP
jgi:RNA polymerase-interacting CarD/CdnL/TRCF family regulator